MNWYNDFRKVTFITNEAKRENRSKGLGVFGWLGVIIWLIVGAAYCSHKEAHSQTMGGWRMAVCGSTCLPLRNKNGQQHIYETQTACETDMTQVTREMPSGTTLYCEPLSMPVPLARPAQPSSSTNTNCRWIGTGPGRTFSCNNR